VFAISTITLGTPAIASPTLNTTQSDDDKKKQQLSYDLKQKVNILDQDLMKMKGHIDLMILNTNKKGVIYER